MNVDIKFVGICGSDILRLDMGQDRMKLGHEIVAQSDDGIYWAVNPLVSCGECILCNTDRTRFCKQLHSYGKDLHGGFSGGMINVRKGNLERISGDNPLPYVLADSLASVIHALNLLPAALGRVLVVGDGTMAALFVRSLSLRNIDCVQAIKDIDREQRVHGDHSVVVFDKLESKNEVDVFDTIIVAVGGRSAHMLNVAARLIKPSGVLIVAGAYHALEDELHIKTILTKEIRVIGPYSYEPFDFIKAIDVIGNDLDFFESMITDVRQNNDINLAFTDHLSKRNRVKVVVEF